MKLEEDWAWVNGVLSLAQKFVDKADWPDGPWKEEPDKLQWVDEKTNLDCLIVRSWAGNLCGYVGVPESHPLFAKDHHDIPGCSVHGSVNFSSFCQEGGPSSVCHVPFSGRPAWVWWFGFDCGHHADASPGAQAELRTLLRGWAGEFMGIWPFGKYRDIAYVRQECAELAAQLLEVVPDAKY